MKRLITTSILPILGLFFLLPTMRIAVAKETPEVSSPTDVKPGMTALLTSKKRMRYFLRVPKSYKKKHGARLVIFMHGSNMNGLDYLKSFEAKGWCRDNILVCPNGEKGEDPHGRNNFTFGSAPYVAGVTEEVCDAFKTTRVYIGGHSQGGFVTYSVIMNFPKLYHGAFPMAGDCWMQNEPNLWYDQEEFKHQKKIAIAVIHGKQDSVVKFSQEQHAYDVFKVMGYPKLRLFAPERLGHQFMLSPVTEGLEWLDSMVGDNPKVILRHASKYAKAREWGWVAESAKRVLALENASKSHKKEAKKALKLVEKSARQEAEKMDVVLKESVPSEWLSKWYDFRLLFGETEAAAKMVKRFEKRRASPWGSGRSLFQKARGHFQNKQESQACETLQRLLKKAPASYEAYYAVRWLDDC